MILNSTVRNSIGDGTGGSSDIHEANGALEFMMPGLVKQIADGHYANRFSSEVHRQAGRRSSENAHDRIEFASAVLQIGARNRKVCATQGRGAKEKNFIFRIPELVLGLGRVRSYGDKLDQRIRSCCGGWSVGKWSLPEGTWTQSGSD